jgi:precorrin-6x reductase
MIIMSATFDQLKAGGIRSLVDKSDPNAARADNILAVCAPAQIALDMYMTAVVDIQAETIATLDAWRGALLLASQAMSDARDLVASTPSTVEVSVDALTVTHRKRVFPETPEVPHARR